MEHKKDQHKVNPATKDTNKDKSASTDLSKDKTASIDPKHTKPVVKPIVGTDQHRK